MSEQEVLLARYADEDATTTVDLGGGESAVVRAEIGEGEMRAASTRGGFTDGTGRFNGGTSDQECIATFTRSWTLRARDGTPLEITARNASLLDDKAYLALMEQIQKATPEMRRALPKASGDPSPDSSPESASPNRAQRRSRR